MEWRQVLKRATTIICSLVAAVLLSGALTFAQDPASGGSDTRNRDPSGPGTSDQTVGGRSSAVIGETDTPTTGGRDERRRERPRDVRQDDKSSGKQETRPRQPSGSDSSLFKSRLDRSATSVVGSGNKNLLKLKPQQPKPRVGPGPK